MQNKTNLKIFHLVFGWLFIFGIVFVLYIARGGYLEEAEIKNIAQIFVYMFAVQVTVILIQSFFSIERLFNKLYFKIHELKRKKIEKNTFTWISDEKIGNVSELITTLDLRNKDFDRNCKNSIERYSFIKLYIREKLSEQEINLWHSQLKVKDKNKNIMSFIIAIVFSYSAIREFLSFIPEIYVFIMSFYSAIKLVGLVLFVDVVFFIFLVGWGILSYVMYDSRMTSFFIVILKDLSEDIQKEKENDSVINEYKF